MTKLILALMVFFGGCGDDATGAGAAGSGGAGGAQPCTLTRDEQTGTAVITSARETAPECAASVSGLVGGGLSVDRGMVAVGVPFNVTHVTEGACTFVLDGSAVLPVQGADCGVTVGLTLTVVR